jgi:hypothetical protein
MRILRSDGTVVGAFEYDAWGRYLHNAPPPEGTRFGFSAPAWMVLRDAPGGDIILSPTRWYIDEAGRFGQRDPVHSSTNRSRYLLVNPLDGSDATGAWNTEHLTWIRKYDEGKHIPCIIAGSDFVDNNMQKNDPAHGMTTSPSYLPTDAETAASIQQYESFLKSELQQAVTLALQATTPAERGLAMFHLGRAIHAVQDVNTHRGVTIRMHWLAWFKASGEPGTEKLPTMTAHDFDNSRKSPSEQAGKTVYDLFIDNMQAGAGKKKLDNLRKCPCAPHQEGQSDWPVVAPIMGFVMADIKNRKSDILDMEGSNDLRRWLHPWKTASHLQ